MAALALLPIWTFMYVRSVTAQAEEASGPLAMGAEIYANCAACHGGAGGGGVGYAFTEGEVLLTFPNIEDQLRYVLYGTGAYNVAGVEIYGNPDRPGGPHVTGARGAMPGFEGALTDYEILSVVCHERYTLSGADPGSRRSGATSSSTGARRARSTSSNSRRGRRSPPSTRCTTAYSPSATARPPGRPPEPTELRPSPGGDGMRPLIIGGGPAGTAAAITLAERGVPARLIDRRGVAAPIDKACGGLLTPRAVHLLGSLGLEVASLGRPIDFVDLVARGRRQRIKWPTSTDAGETTGIVVSRDRLDSALLDRASELGVEVELGREAIEPIVERGFVRGVRPRTATGVDRAGRPAPRRRWREQHLRARARHVSTTGLAVGLGAPRHAWRHRAPTVSVSNSTSTSSEARVTAFRASDGCSPSTTTPSTSVCRSRRRRATPPR